jgi:hypothetical protein
VSAHTPGPCEWGYDDGEGRHVIRMGSACGYANGYESHHVLEYEHVLYPEDGAQYDEAEANTRLIAAAPELLDIVRRYVAACLEQNILLGGITGDAQDLLARLDGGRS